MLLGVRLSNFFWREVVHTGIYLINKSLT